MVVHVWRRGREGQERSRARRGAALDLFLEGRVWGLCLVCYCFCSGECQREKSRSFLPSISLQTSVPPQVPYLPLQTRPKATQSTTYISFQAVSCTPPSASAVATKMRRSKTRHFRKETRVLPNLTRRKQTEDKC